jgi:hypothetical protein
MVYADQNVIEHDFGFPRVVNSAEAKLEVLYAMLVSLGATKMIAQRVMTKFPDHGIA